MVRSRLLIGFLVWALSLPLVAQDRYMVFFSDKEGTSYSLDNPEQFLSERAIARREKMNIPITVQDLPVNQSYIDEVASKGAEVYFTSKWFNAVLVQMTGGLVSSVGNLPFVDSVVYVAKGVRLSNEKTSYTIPEEFLELDNQNSSTVTQLRMLGADQMHEDGFRGEGMIIAVFDSGFPGINEYKPFEHIFDDDRLLGSRDFVTNSGNVFQFNSHGSSVFSCIGASMGETIQGTAPQASFVLCVTEDVTKEYRIEEYNWLFAAEYADSLGVDVINGSLGYSTFSDNNMNYTYADMDGRTTIVTQAAELAAEKGMVVVVSAGNEGNNKWTYITGPADANNVLAVGSVTSTYQRANHSSFGPTADGRIKPDVAALGSFTSIFSGSGYTSGNGTSFASPQVAGFAAAVWQAHPEWSNMEVIEAIKMSGTNVVEPDSIVGYGVPNYHVAVNGSTIAAADVLEDKLTVYPNPFADGRIFIDFGEVELRGKIDISVRDVQGKLVYESRFDSRDLPNQLEIEINPIVNGVYFLTLQTKKFNKTVKLIKI